MRPRIPNDAELSKAPPASELDDLSILLEEIQHEKVPERLLGLAEQLQAALLAKRNEGLSDQD